MHVPNPLGHSFWCLFLRLLAPPFCSLQVTVSLPAPCCYSLFVKIGLFNILGFVCVVFRRHSCSLLLHVRV